MFITSLSHQNKQSGWTLQKLSLDRFNLLVGASGVGKTQILRALRKIQRIVLTGRIQGPMAFIIAFHHEDINYEWELECSLSEHSSDNSPRSAGAPTVSITQEKLTSSSDGILVNRNQEKFLFKGKELPQLNRSETALKLIDEEPIFDVVHAISTGILDDHPYNASVLLDDEAESLIKETQDLEDWQQVLLLPPQVKALLLQKKLPEKFDQLKSTFKDIFTSVEDISVEATSTPSTARRISERRLQFKIKEYGTQHWVPAADISSGMLRTLMHLVDLMLAPKGSVVLIDEFENSLGVNCMGPLTDFILSRAAELQFIITSHHPYIINKIPKTHWKVVRRHGSTVKVTPAGEVRALQGSSAQDDFTRLINSPEFEEGVA